MQKEDLLVLEDLCTYEEPPACQSFCPVHVEVRDVVRLLAAGKTAEARKALDRHLPLASLTGWLCEGACREHCLRQGLDSGLSLPLLERFIVQNTRTAKPFPMPATANRAAAVGTSLAALALAFDLGRRGHKVTLFETGPRGGSLLNTDGRLPAGELEEALGMVEGLGNPMEPAPEQTPQFLEKLLADFKAVFIDLGDPSVDPKALGLTEAELIPDPVTCQSARERVFLAPSWKSDRPFLMAAAAAKKTAGSLTRIYQGVAPNSARTREEVFQTTLAVDISQEAVKPEIVPASPAEFTEEEARAEAGRCLDCTCQNCLKVCPLLRFYKGHPKKMAREIYNNVITAYAIRASNIFINSCTECELCREVCPNSADTGAFVSQCRRYLVEINHMPVSAHEFALEDMVSANAPDSGFFRLPPGKTSCRKIFFPGCQLTASRPQTAALAYEHLLKTQGDTALLSGCCGAPARWSGRSLLTGQVLGQIRQIWAENQKPVLILACPSCYLFFQKEFPEAEIVSLWEVLAENPPEAPASSLKLTLHDPCAARYEEGIQKSVRSLLEKAAPNFSEQQFSGRQTKCCGYGGLTSQVNDTLGWEFSRDTAADGQPPLVSYCIMCRDRFQSAGFPSLHLLDLLFPAGDPAVLAEQAAPNLTQRRDGRLEFRRQILSELWQENVEQTASASPPELVISPELYGLMEKKRILRPDIEAVVSDALANGPNFYNEITGRSLACLRPRQVTFWVEYSQDPEGRFVIHQAWCHRMVVPGVAGEGAESPATLEGFARTGGRV
ncbi:MAG: 4Fe-4S dicluster domain-containing protein [Deltaproteobacteria bacterium]|jgi:Fe-S oxidoreductase|nr:4Fe-4S dicluster domain-containing protein [Deltaproteobacteria bacterium]